jgi:hypothetical protein
VLGVRRPILAGVRRPRVGVLPRHGASYPAKLLAGITNDLVLCMFAVQCLARTKDILRESHRARSR